MTTYQRILVHAGLSKTGSTSIQANCRQHRDTLAAHGICYPQFQFEGQAFANHSLPVVAALTGSTTRYGLRLEQRYPGRSQALLNAANEQLDQLLNRGSGHTLLLSTELIEGIMAPDAVSLCERLLPYCEQLDLLVYVRSPLTALESLLQERIKAGALVRPEILVGRTKEKLSRLRRLLGEYLQVANFHEALQRPRGLIGDFYTRLGVPDEVVQALHIETHNQRLSVEAFELMLAINEHYPRDACDEHGVRRMPGDLNALAALPGVPFHLPNFEGSQLQGYCEAEARWLARNFGLAFPEEVGARDADRHEPWSSDSCAALAQGLSGIEQRVLRAAALDYLECAWITEPVIAAKKLDFKPEIGPDSYSAAVRQSAAQRLQGVWPQLASLR